METYRAAVTMEVPTPAPAAPCRFADRRAVLEAIARVLCSGAPGDPAEDLGARVAGVETVEVLGRAGFIDQMDGDPLGVACAVANALRKQHVPEGEVDSFCREALSGDYDKVLKTAMSWISFL